MLYTVVVCGVSEELSICRKSRSLSFLVNGYKSLVFYFILFLLSIFLKLSFYFLFFFLS